MGGVLVLLVLLILLVSVKRVRARWHEPLPAAHSGGGAVPPGLDGQAGGSVILLRLGEPAGGLDDATVATLGPVFEHSAERVLEGESECPVCLAEYKEGEHLRMLDKCSHHFHQECIDVWLKSNASCPLCRTSLRPDKDDAPAAYSARHPDPPTMLSLAQAPDHHPTDVGGGQPLSNPPQPHPPQSQEQQVAAMV